jgi:uncharacterized protein (TIRG00374 family)
LKLVVNLVLSVAMLALFAWLAYFRGHQWHDLKEAFHHVEYARVAPALAGCFGLMVIVHLFRAWRWRYLLRPIGVELPFGRLMSVSTVGFMAILALPARLGEFVRPYLIRDGGKVSMTSALGTVAVERVIDGLLISLLVFTTCSLRAHEVGAAAPGWMMPTAYISLAIFAAAMLFLLFMLRWPDWTVKWTLILTGLRRFAPKLGEKVGDKMHSLIRGFRVLKRWRDLIVFTLMTIVYWVANGLSVWVLAKGFDLGPGLSVVGAFTVMGLVAVGITLPNSPGLVGQYTWFTSLGLSLYFSKDIVESGGKVFAVFSHATQVVWYLTTGAVALLASRISLSRVVRASTEAVVEAEPAKPAEGA